MRGAGTRRAISTPGRGEVNSVARLDAVGDGDAACFEQGGQAHGGSPGGIVHGDGKRERRGACLDAAVDADGGVAGDALGEDEGFEFGIRGDGVDVVVDVVEFGRSAIADLALRAVLRAGCDDERHFVAVDGERGNGLARAGDDVIEAPARRPGFARIERLVGDDGFDFGDAVGEHGVGEGRETVTFAIQRVDQRGVAGADEEERGRGAFGGDEA